MKLPLCLFMLLGKARRLQFVECPSDLSGMIDAAKFADLALLLIDGSYGFEMVSDSKKISNSSIVWWRLTLCSD